MASNGIKAFGMIITKRLNDIELKKGKENYVFMKGFVTRFTV